MVHDGVRRARGLHEGERRVEILLLVREGREVGEVAAEIHEARRMQPEEQRRLGAVRVPHCDLQVGRGRARRELGAADAQEALGGLQVLHAAPQDRLRRLLALAELEAVVAVGRAGRRAPRRPDVRERFRKWVVDAAGGSRGVMPIAVGRLSLGKCSKGKCGNGKGKGGNGKGRK